MLSKPFLTSREAAALAHILEQTSRAWIDADGECQ